MSRSSEKGQGLVEYALILVLVAVVVIAVLLILGPIIGNVFTKINSELLIVADPATGGGDCFGWVGPCYPHIIKIGGDTPTPTNCGQVGGFWENGWEGLGCYQHPPY